ncbi:DUF4190 domain-containing protein [Verrucosispora sp. WMMA2121]|uniref:DUF4190 domain-containing protein n=1 Tax=Verrucosispora sp. WMMA2121 TaxID=3015164 RepID=UPI0022B6000C|nr:DUF4190 domain-containing protein [Verrucosispora sp. WMMA2121]MCZ7421039.1 DUF4190 domain-containing protein [Verrucosispora sp. WMMA2121]
MGQPPEPDQPPSPYEPPPGGQQPQYGQPYGQQGEQPAYGQPSYEHPGQPPHGQQWGQQPPYAPQVPYGQYGPPAGPGGGRGTNVLAILSLVFAFVFAPAGIALGHLAKRQLRTSGEDGEQLATWGLILSYIFTGLFLLACCGWLALAIWAGSDGTST